MTMTKLQRQKRAELRRKNIASRKRNAEQRRRQTIIDRMPKGLLHRTKPEFLNNELAEFTMCGLWWKPNVRATLFLNNEVTCVKCLQVMDQQKSKFPLNKF